MGEELPEERRPLIDRVIVPALLDRFVRDRAPVYVVERLRPPVNRQPVADWNRVNLKTHNFHWNVTGPMFQALHLMFESQYNELALAVDAVAERIRALGFPAPGTYKQFLQLSSIKDEDGMPKAQDMIRLLVEGHETVARTARQVFKVAERVSDQPTCDLLTQRMQVHEKTAWMLRSLLE